MLLSTTGAAGPPTPPGGAAGPPTPPGGGTPKPGGGAPKPGGGAPKPEGGAAALSHHQEAYQKRSHFYLKLVYHNYIGCSCTH